MESSQFIPQLMGSICSPKPPCDFPSSTAMGLRLLGGAISVIHRHRHISRHMRCRSTVCSGHRPVAQHSMSGRRSSLDQQGTHTSVRSGEPSLQMSKHLGWPLCVVQILYLHGSSGEGTMARTRPPSLLGAACKPFVLER